MKKSILYAAALLLASAGFSSCDDNWQRPPVMVPEATMEANTTILELKEVFSDPNTRDFATVVGTKENGDHYIIKGRITTSDVTGNIYNKLFIEDETSAICASIYVSKLYESYRYGQEVVVDVTGLYIGNYGYLLQIGGAPTGTYANPGRMSEELWTAAAEVNGLADPSLVEAETVTIPELNTIKSNPSELMAWTGRYIKLENVKFKTPGETMANAGTSNNSRTLEDAEGNTIALNNSGYASWASELCPDGYGDVYAILSYYNGNYQLLLSDMDGLVGFTPYQEPEPVDPSTIAVGSFDIGFTPESSTFPEYWTTAFGASAKSGWYIRTFDNNAYINATGYNNGSAPFDLWLISQPIDASKMTDKTLEFDTQVAGYGSTTTVLEVYIMDSPDYTTAKTIKLDPTLAEATASGYSSWVNSGKVSLAEATGIFYIGWRYAATADANYATWCVDNISVK